MFAIAVCALTWMALTAFRHSLSTSSFTVTGQPPKTTFEVTHCGSDARYRYGRAGEVDDAATGEIKGGQKISVPPGCWTIRPDAGGSPGLVPMTAQAPETTASRVALILTLLGSVASLLLLIPAINAVRDSRRAAAAAARGEVVEARVLADDGRQRTSSVFGIGTAMAVGSALALFMSLANGQIRTPFFNFTLMSDKFGLLLSKFALNIKLFVVAELLVLVWGLVVAVARLAPGKAGRPVRWLAIGYIDLFRGIPAVITIVLLDFGMKKSGLGFFADLDDFWYGVMALTLTYGAYVAEVYRAGIESIHWSQTAAARSLGLSYGQTLRHVVVPQGVRRIIPPLLNDFIGLQKDSALVSFIGVTEVFNQARILNSNYFNSSAITLTALFFYVITVPQARFVDRLLAKDQAKRRGGS